MNRQHTSRLRPINAKSQDLETITRQAWSALEETNDPPRLFLHGGVPSRLSLDRDGRPRLEVLTVDRMRHELARSAYWFTENQEGQKVDAKPPLDVVRDILATPNPPLPVLDRIVEVPTFGPDGTLQTEPGYYPASRCYHAPVGNIGFPPIPMKPSPVDVEMARTLMYDYMFSDFPFKSEADKAHAVALFLLPFARDLIDGPTPNHLIESPVPGTGKGLLADVALQPALGRNIAVIAQARDGDEWRKRLTAVFREARAAVIIDNVNRALDSGELAAALTAINWQDRILGESDIIQMPVRCIWVTTANNPAISTEIARRSIRIRLDAQVERPWDRNTFKHLDLRSWVDEHRRELVWSALILIQNWLSLGRPMCVAKPLGSYERWSQVMGSILMFSGISGFLENLDELYENADTEVSGLSQFVAAWREKFSDKEVGVGDLFPLTAGIDLNIEGTTEQAQRISLGRLLSRQRDRIIEGYRITVLGKKQRATLWRLVPINQE
jgi:putative DNA primase/helicase